MARSFGAVSPSNAIRPPSGALSALHTLILPYVADPLLTELGQDQARDAHAMWKEETESGGSLPDKLYCSPMTRAIQTCQITFEGVLDFAECRPLILEVSFRPPRLTRKGNEVHVYDPCCSPSGRTVESSTGCIRATSDGL